MSEELKIIIMVIWVFSAVCLMVVSLLNGRYNLDRPATFWSTALDTLYVLTGPIGLTIESVKCHKQRRDKKKLTKPVIGVVFDGAIHVGGSKHKPITIDGFAIKGAAGNLLTLLNCQSMYDVAIMSYRSNYFGGRAAMKRWLKEQLISWLETRDDETVMELLQRHKTVKFNAGMEPRDLAAREWADTVISQIKWPKKFIDTKVIIATNVIPFRGLWPSLNDIVSFKPWIK